MDTTLFVDDDGFVRAPAARCYEALSQLRRWPDFWPRLRVTDGGGTLVRLVAGRRPRRLRLWAVPGAWRPDRGFTMTLSGDLVGSWEIWLEPGWGGTVIHHLLTAEGSAAWQQGAFRRWARRGTWGLKDLLEAETLASTAGVAGTGDAASGGVGRAIGGPGAAS